MFASTKPTKKRPVYFECHVDGFWCSVDGVPEYFKTRQEMYMFACSDEREVIEITFDNEPALRRSGAFDAIEVPESYFHE